MSKTDGRDALDPRDLDVRYSHIPSAFKYMVLSRIGEHLDVILTREPGEGSRKYRISVLFRKGRRPHKDDASPVESYFVVYDMEDLVRGGNSRSTEIAIKCADEIVKGLFDRKA